MAFKVGMLSQLFEKLIGTVLYIEPDAWVAYTYPKAPSPTKTYWGYPFFMYTPIELPPVTDFEIIIIEDDMYTVRVPVRTSVDICFVCDDPVLMRPSMEIHEVQFNVGLRMFDRDFKVGIFINQLENHEGKVFIRKSDWEFVKKVCL